MLGLHNNKPTEPGWYYCDYDNWIHVVRVSYIKGTTDLMFDSAYDDEDRWGDLRQYLDRVDVDKTICHWSEKLEEPAEYTPPNTEDNI